MHSNNILNPLLSPNSFKVSIYMLEISKGSGHNIVWLSFEPTRKPSVTPKPPLKYSPHDKRTMITSTVSLLNWGYFFPKPGP